MLMRKLPGSYRLRPPLGKLCRLLFFGLFGLYVAGCGYTLNNRLQSTFTGSKGYFIPVFSNETQEVGAEMIFTNALIRELESHGDRVVNGKGAGIYEIHGRVIRVTRTVEATTSGRRLQKYQSLPEQVGVRVRVGIRLMDMENQKEVWGQELEGFRRVTIPGNRTSDADAPSSIAANVESLVETTYADISRDMMRDVYDLMLEVF